MKQKKFMKELFDGVKELNEDKKYAVRLLVKTEEQADILNEFIFSEDNKSYVESDVEDSVFIIKFIEDVHEDDVVWLYKYSVIGVLIDSLYGLPFTEHEILKKMLIGKSITDIERDYYNFYDEDKFDEYSNNYYKPIHPYHRNYDKVIFDDENRDKHAPYTHAKYWEDTGNPNMPEFIEVEE